MHCCQEGIILPTDIEFIGHCKTKARNEHGHCSVARDLTRHPLQWQCHTHIQHVCLDGDLYKSRRYPFCNERHPEKLHDSEEMKCTKTVSMKYGDRIIPRMHDQLLKPLLKTYELARSPGRMLRGVCGVFLHRGSPIATNQ